jgi:hypothetical protein
MFGVILKNKKNKLILTIMKNDKLLREVELIEGNEYIVNPLNSLKKKHRGRKVIFKTVKSIDGYTFAEVKFLDTKRPGRVEVDDLDNIE